MAVNNLDLDVKFWDLGPGWRLYSTQPLSLDLYSKKYTKPLYVFVFSKVMTVWISTCTSIRDFFAYSKIEPLEQISS